MMRRLAFVFVLILLSGTVLAEIPDEIESSYTVQTLITKESAYISLETREPGECEYGTDEFIYGEGNKFDSMNGTSHSAKISIEEGTSYRFKIKCVVSGKSGEENIMFSVSHITFFLLDRLEELKGDVSLFREQRDFYGNYINVEDVDSRIAELEATLGRAENAIKRDDIEGLRSEVSIGLQEKSEIENFLLIKSFQLSILNSSRYVVIMIILVYLIAYALSSFFLPYMRLNRNIRTLEEKESNMTNLRQNTEMLYFHRKIDEDTFNKMLIKEQEEILRVRAKIAGMKDRKKELAKKIMEPRTIIEWSVKERIHTKDRVKKLLEKIKSMKYKVRNV